MLTPTYFALTSFTHFSLRMVNSKRLIFAQGLIHSGVPDAWSIYSKDRLIRALIIRRVRLIQTSSLDTQPIESHVKIVVLIIRRFA